MGPLSCVKGAIMVRAARDAVVVGKDRACAAGTRVYVGIGGVIPAASRPTQQTCRQQIGPPAATGRRFTVRRSDVHLLHENRCLAVFQTAEKVGEESRRDEA